MQESISPLGLRRRFCAYIVDLIVVTALLIVFSIALSFSWSLAFFVSFAFVTQVLFWFYSALCESSRWQATIGKRLFGMKVIDQKGSRISFLRASVRFWSKLLSAASLWWGFFMIAWTENKQGLHDKISDTLVVKRVSTK